MTLDEFIEYFRYPTAIGFSFSESQQIANYLEELKIVRKALEMSCKDHRDEMKFDDKAIIKADDIVNFYLERASEGEVRQ